MAGGRSWLAALVSALQPGLGTAYAGERRRGLAIWLTFWALVVAVVALGYWGRPAAVVAGMWCILALVFLYPWSILDAWRTAKGADFRSRPWVAALLSLFLPGLGQAYLGRTGRAWKIWGYVSAAWVLFVGSMRYDLPGVVTDATAILAISTGLAPVLSAYDAYKTARRESEVLSEEAVRSGQRGPQGPAT
ncbi:MAG: hypothetical protein QI223_10565 [Candidatus Korarchaeota archaeon]|nr:hypothetical protein [Candidatus Korarchaeota archaeon]